MPETHDVFISYSGANAAWVRGWLVPRLIAAGCRVCVDYEAFPPGGPSAVAMERAVLGSRKSVAVLTPAYCSSEYCEFESLLMHSLDPAARARRVIPLLLEPCQELPLRLRMLTYVDFTALGTQDMAFEKLLAAIRSDTSVAELVYQGGVAGLTKGPLILDGDPLLLFEGTFCRESQTDVAFTLLNNGHGELLVTAVYVTPYLFLEVKDDTSDRLRSELGPIREMPRLMLAVDLQSLKGSERCRRAEAEFRPRFNHPGQRESIAVLGPESVMRIQARDAEFVALSIQEPSTSPRFDGFVCFIVIELSVLSGTAGSQRLTVDHLIEVARAPGDSVPQVHLHFLGTSEAVSHLGDHALADGAAHEVLQRLESGETFSDGFLMHLSGLLKEGNVALCSRALLAYIEVAKAKQHSDHSDTWYRALLRILHLIDPAKQPFQISVLSCSSHLRTHLESDSRLAGCDAACAECRIGVQGRMVVAEFLRRPRP